MLSVYKNPKTVVAEAIDLTLAATALNNVIGFVNQVRGGFTDYFTTKSLAEVTKLTRVEPLCIISNSAANNEVISDVVQSILSLNVAYYLQAVDLLTKIKDVEVVRILDKLNPNRDSSALFFTSEDISSDKGIFPYSLATAGFAKFIESIPKTAAENKPSSPEDAMAMANLSVGKLINVNICTKVVNKDTEEEREINVTFPVNFRLICSRISDNSIVSILAMKHDDTSFVERAHGVMSGRLAFWRDFVMCSDMITEYKRAAMKDETKTLAEIQRRANNAKKFGVMTKNPSLVTASNIFVLTSEAARLLEARLGGRLNDVRTRNKAFEGTYAFIIAVIDSDFMTVTFHIRDIEKSTTVGFKDLKTASKGKGPDIMDLFRQMSSFNAPTF